VLIAGDSVGHSLFPALQRAGAARGVQVESAALFACPVVDGVPVDDEGKPFPTVPGCPVNRPEHYRGAVARFRPDVVVWVSSWETSARIVAGRLSLFGTIDGNRDLIQRIDEAVGWLTSTGARVVFVPLAPSAQPSARGVPSPTNDARIVELGNVLRAYSRQHSGATSVVDLPALICPQGPPCPAEVDGVVPRTRRRHPLRADRVGVDRRSRPAPFAGARVALAPGERHQRGAHPTRLIPASGTRSWANTRQVASARKGQDMTRSFQRFAGWAALGAAAAGLTFTVTFSIVVREGDRWAKWVSAVALTTGGLATLPFTIALVRRHARP